MPIANYTTSVPTNQSAAEVTQMLVMARVQAVMTEYDGLEISAISFRITKAAQQLHFRLPANWRGVLEALKKDPKVERRCKTPEQAKRVAWRIMRDWMRAQLALIEAGAVEIDEVMLPYMLVAGDRTLYQTFKDSGFKALPEPRP